MNLPTIPACVALAIVIVWLLAIPVFMWVLWRSHRAQRIDRIRIRVKEPLRRPINDRFGL